LTGRIRTVHGSRLRMRWLCEIGSFVHKRIKYLRNMFNCLLLDEMVLDNEWQACENNLNACHERFSQLENDLKFHKRKIAQVELQIKAAEAKAKAKQAELREIKTQRYTEQVCEYDLQCSNAWKGICWQKKSRPSVMCANCTTFLKQTGYSRI